VLTDRAGGQAPRALITGLTGQDGSFLAELLLERGYEVTGLVRRSAADALGCAEHLRERVKLVRGDLLQPATLRAAIEQVRPHEIYHLAAPSFVPASWERPAETIDAIVGSATAILESVRDGDREARVLICASGSIYGETPLGETPQSPQNEHTPARPTTPYAIAKLAAHQLAGVMRAHSGLHVSSAITYNHESERRPERFVTRRITRGAAAISLGLQNELALGSLQAVRDWSFAGDVVRGEWSMLQQDDPGDYVLASGVGRTVAEFACLDLDAERFLRVDPSLVRPPERTPNVGDPRKAKDRLGWEPQVSFQALVERMVDADLRALRETHVRS
jgi:GDPmannose 4,6-dehydratase